MANTSLTQTQAPGTRVTMVGPYGQQDALLADATVPPPASSILYTPAQPTFWTIPAPVNVQEALDDLAIPTPQSAVNGSGALGPAASVSFATGNITPVKGGRFLFWVWATCNTTASSTLTLQLRVDGIDLTGVLGSCRGDVGWSAQLSLGYTIALNRATTHTFGASVTASAGTVTVPINTFRVTLVEF